MSKKTLGYVAGVGTYSNARAIEEAEAIAAVLRPWYASGKLAGFRSCAVLDEESYDEVVLDPEVVAHKVQGKFPFVCVTITFDTASLPAGAAAPDGWDAIVKARALESL